jgi:serine/threonine protein kinase
MTRLVELWPSLSGLLDHALELPPSLRREWLESMTDIKPEVRLELSRLLLSLEEIEAGSFLEQMPLTGKSLAAPMEWAPGMTIGGYIIESEAGRGGMGIVYRAIRADGLIKRPVALKLIHPSMESRELLARFARERDILARLDHPNIARLYDAGTAATGQPYLALEFVAGKPIDRYCDDLRLDLRQRIALFGQVMDAVQFAHANLVIHRDLKPSNMLVTADGGLRLLDFGIARPARLAADLADPKSTFLGPRAMTPDYAAPEQILGEQVSTASDVYSLGVVLYELLCGERPYRLARSSVAALEEAIVGVTPAPPSRAAFSPEQAAARSTTRRALARSLAGNLDAITLKALAKNPADRYPTVDAFAQDLTRHLTGDVVQARPARLSNRLLVFLRKNRLIVGATASVIVALGAGLGIALSQARRAEQQAAIARREAETARVEARTADAVQTFMEGVFSANGTNQPDPVRARQTTARELLDIGAAKIDSELADAPAAQIRALSTLIEIYDDLGVQDKALELARKRVALARRGPPGAPATLAEFLSELGNFAAHAGFPEEALSALQEGTRILDAVHDHESGARGDLELSLADYWVDRDLRQALTHAEESAAIWRRIPGAPHFVDALAGLSSIAAQSGDFARATATATEAIARAQDPVHPINSALPLLYESLAEAQVGLNDFAGAERSHRAALAAALRSSESASTRPVLETAARLARFLTDTGRSAEALGVLRDIRGRGVAPLLTPNQADQRAKFDSGIGYALIAYGQFEQGYREARSADDEFRGKNNDEVGYYSILDTEASALIEMGRYGDAEGLLARSEAAQRSIQNDRTHYFDRNVLLRVDLALARGKPSTAAAALEEYHLESASTPDSSRLGLIRRLNAGRIQLAAGDLADADRTLGEVATAIAASPQRSFLAALEASTGFTAGQVKLRLGAYAQAQSMLQRAIEFQRASFDPLSSLAIADTDIALAQCAAAQGDVAAARDLLAAAENIHAAHRAIGAHHLAQLGALRRLLSRSSAPGRAPR